MRAIAAVDDGIRDARRRRGAHRARSDAGLHHLGARRRRSPRAAARQHEHQQRAPTNTPPRRRTPISPRPRAPARRAWRSVRRRRRPRSSRTGGSTCRWAPGRAVSVRGVERGRDDGESDAAARDVQGWREVRQGGPLFTADGRRQRHELRRQLGHFRPRHRRARPAHVHAAALCGGRADQGHRSAVRRHRARARRVDGDHVVRQRRLPGRRARQRQAAEADAARRDRVHRRPPRRHRHAERVPPLRRPRASQLRAGADLAQVRRARVGLRRLDLRRSRRHLPRSHPHRHQGKPRRRRRAPRVLRTRHGCDGQGLRGVGRSRAEQGVHA